MNLSLSVQQDYYNKSALKAIALLFLIYAGIDFFLLDYSKDNAFSISAYLKFIICLLFMIGSKETTFFFEKGGSITAAMDMSIILLCVSLAIINIFIVEHPLSKYLGIGLLLGVPSLIHLLSNAINKIEIKAFKSNVINMLRFTLGGVAILYFSIILLFFIVGEWDWYIKSISDLIGVHML